MAETDELDEGLPLRHPSVSGTIVSACKQGDIRLSHPAALTCRNQQPPQGPRTRSLNLATLYCGDISHQALPSPLISPLTPQPVPLTTMGVVERQSSLPEPETSAAVTEPLLQNEETTTTTEESSEVPPEPASTPLSNVIMVRHRPLSPKATTFQQRISLSNNGGTPTQLPPLRPPGFRQGSLTRPTSTGQQRRSIYRLSSSAGAPGTPAPASSRSQGRTERNPNSPLAKVERVVSETAWFLIGLRHLVAEVPLLVLWALYPTPYLVPLFWTSVAAVIVPGFAALFLVLRNKENAPKSWSHRLACCVLLPLRLESFLRLLELAIPSWKEGEDPWPSRLAIVQAGPGSTIQLLVQSASLGWCCRHTVLPYFEPNFPRGDFSSFVFSGQDSIMVLPPNPCDPTLMGLHIAVLIISLVHVPWAMAESSRRKLRSVMKGLSVGLILERTALVTATIGNIILAGCRVSLIVAAVTAGWETWHIATLFTIGMTIRLTVTLSGRLFCGNNYRPPIDVWRLVCTLMTVEPNAPDPSVLARRCFIFGVMNAVKLLVVALSTHGPGAAGAIYKLGVLISAATITGVLLLVARLRWVLPSAAAPVPAEGGKCFTKRSPQDHLLL